MVKAKVFLYAKSIQGYPDETNFELVEEELPELKDGEFLAEALYISVDPYMRILKLTQVVGGPFTVGDQIAKITESKNPSFPVGVNIIAPFGWRSHTISDGKQVGISGPVILPDFEGHPLSLALGILGMTGITAHFGFLNISQPKEGDTVVISGAAGAVGSTVGQIAKIKGCKVIGLAGSQEKGNWMVNELGFDCFINYKTANLDEELSKIAPQGANVYFDNVGGDTSTTILKHIGKHGRVAVCGAISGYNNQNPKPIVLPIDFLQREMRIESFVWRRWSNRITEVQKAHLKWIKEGKLKYRETVTKGFENTPKAFIDMLKGENVGKAVVKV